MFEVYLRDQEEKAIGMSKKGCAWMIGLVKECHAIVNEDLSLPSSYPIHDLCQDCR